MPNKYIPNRNLVKNKQYNIGLNAYQAAAHDVLCNKYDITSPELFRILMRNTAEAAQLRSEREKLIIEIQSTDARKHSAA